MFDFWSYWVAKLPAAAAIECRCPFVHGAGEAEMNPVSSQRKETHSASPRNSYPICSGWKPSLGRISTQLTMPE